MAKILCIESATELCSVAVAIDGVLTALHESKEARSHTQVITLLIDEALQASKLDYKDLDAIAVSSGPGSYTSLRIGVSTAKGMCFGLGIPLIAVDTLHALAMNIVGNHKDKYHRIIATIDARRMEVYEGQFDGLGIRLHPDVAKVYTDEYFNELQEGDIICGTGVEKVASMLAERDVSYAHYPASASFMIPIAVQKYEDQEFEDLAYFVPNYIKPVRIIKSKKKLL